MAEGESIRKTRGPTRLKDVMISDDKVPVQIHPITGRPSGLNKVKFVTFLGSLARKMVSILTPTWEDVSEVDKNLIWEIFLSKLFISILVNNVCVEFTCE